MKFGIYKYHTYKEIGTTLTHNAVGIWYLTINLWWWYIEIQFNKEREEDER